MAKSYFFTMKQIHMVMCFICTNISTYSVLYLKILNTFIDSIMRKILTLSLLFICTSYAGADLLFKNGFEKIVTRVALSQEIAGVTHVGWLDIDTNQWFDMTDYFDTTYGATGIDDWVSISSDLNYYLLETERPMVFQGWDGLTWGAFDENGIPSEPMVVDGAPHPEGFCTISAGGTHIAMILRDESDRSDIWIVNRIGDVWQRDDEVNISSSSAGNNGGPQFSPTNNKVIWTSYTKDGMDFDENSLDGSNFNQLLSHTRLGPSAKMIRPAYENSGTIVFEGELDGEQCYRWDPAIPEVDPVIIASAYSNDNSCTALVDGRIASFWLERPDGPSVHELRVMKADGTHQAVLQMEIDFWDFLITGGSKTE